MAKFALVTTQVEEFENLESLEHYIKEHSPLDFDDKVDLLKSRKIIIDGEDEATVTIEILTELGAANETATEDKTENGAQDGPRT